MVSLSASYFKIMAVNFGRKIFLKTSKIYSNFVLTEKWQ